MSVPYTAGSSSALQICSDDLFCLVMSCARGNDDTTKNNEMDERYNKKRYEKKNGVYDKIKLEKEENTVEM